MAGDRTTSQRSRACAPALALLGLAFVGLLAPAPCFDAVAQPKRPPNPFQLWVRENRPRLKTEVRTKSSGAFMKEAGRQWREIGESEKSEYVKRAAEGLREYEAKLQAKKPKAKADKDPNEPKRQGGTNAAGGAEERVVLLVGETGAGKSTFGNNLLDVDTFITSNGAISCTTQTSLKVGVNYNALTGRALKVLDIVGLGDTRLSEEEVVASIKEMVFEARDGIDTIAFVMRLGRVTQGMRRIFDYMTRDLFGHECLANVVIVITNAKHQLKSEEKTIKWISDAQGDQHFAHMLGLLNNNRERIFFVDHPEADEDDDEHDKRKQQELKKLSRSRFYSFLNKPLLPPKYRDSQMRAAEANYRDRLEQEERLREAEQRALEDKIRKEATESERQKLEKELEDMKESMRKMAKQEAMKHVEPNGWDNFWNFLGGAAAAVGASMLR